MVDIGNKINSNKYILLTNSSEYQEKYVALKKILNNKPKDVISFGEDASKVIDEAREKGYQNPIVMYIPKIDTQIFSERSFI